MSSRYGSTSTTSTMIKAPSDPNPTKTLQDQRGQIVIPGRLDSQRIMQARAARQNVGARNRQDASRKPLYPNIESLEDPNVSIAEFEILFTHPGSSFNTASDPHVPQGDTRINLFSSFNGELISYKAMASFYGMRYTELIKLLKDEPVYGNFLKCMYKYTKIRCMGVSRQRQDQDDVLTTPGVSCSISGNIHFAHSGSENIMAGDTVIWSLPDPGMVGNNRAPINEVLGDKILPVVGPRTAESLPNGQFLPFHILFNEDRSLAPMFGSNKPLDLASRERTHRASIATTGYRLGKFVLSVATRQNGNAVYSLKLNEGEHVRSTEQTDYDIIAHSIFDMKTAIASGVAEAGVPSQKLFESKLSFSIKMKPFVKEEFKLLMRFLQANMFDTQNRVLGVANRAAEPGGLVEITGTNTCARVL